MAKKCQKLSLSAVTFKNWYLCKNTIVFSMMRAFSKSLIITFGKIMCLFEYCVSPADNMAIEFFGFL